MSFTPPQPQFTVSIVGRESRYILLIIVEVVFTVSIKLTGDTAAGCPFERLTKFDLALLVLGTAGEYNARNVSVPACIPSD